MSFTGGLGRQGFGLRSFGAGGPLTVVRAGAIASHVVRVVFNVQPLYRSPAGRNDGLNPSNYLFTVPGGNAVAPIAMGVDREPIVGPTYLVGNGSAPGAADERGMDVHVDRALVVGVVYNVRANNIEAMVGGALSTPDNADFVGVTKLAETKLPQRNQDLVDIANPPGSGHWVVDDSGDLAVESPDQGTRKRCLRRLSTKKNAFKTLPGYGLAVNLKELASVAKLTELRIDAIRQLSQEPDVAKASVDVSQTANGVTTIAVRVRTRRGTFVDINGTVTAVGQIETAR